MDLNERYRIHRSDKRNWAIQRKTDSGNWVTQSYHGLSPKSLSNGLLELVVSNMTLEDAKLYEQAKTLQLGIVEGLDDLKKIIEKAELK